MADGKFLKDFSRKPDPRDLFQFGICGLSYKEKTQRICGESGAQEFRAGGELRHSHLHDRVVTAANHVFLDLSFGVCCHSSLKNKTVSGHFGSWDSL